ncbi:xylose isomerase-like protein [Schizophyllum amplum]|uniref:Apurinic-apyrimidinic endonuclease 1 n=1 Tax=Schizophyllum amplum TaxID=97359 RepID=A0A550CCN9_9AGAR|nr:xylose isomerase-like protein [Auriculariopsis ampla]
MSETRRRITRSSTTRAASTSTARRPAKRPRLDCNDASDDAGSGPIASASVAVTETIVTETEELVVKPKRKRQAAKVAPPPAPRVDSPWKIGAHVSTVGGVENAIGNALAIGANAFALFVKSQRKWESAELRDTSVSLFAERIREHGYDPKHILPHGSYLVNLGNPDAEKRAKSYDCFVDDLKRCEQLGLVLYNFHPGSTVGQTTVEESLSLIAECLNRAHKETTNIVTVIENMAGAGNVIGGDFSHIAGIINQVEDKERVGVCFDTYPIPTGHGYSAGYDIATKEGWDAVMSDFDKQIGLKYLRALHLNDSKTPHNSKKDRHENIGQGTLGLAAFHHISSKRQTATSQPWCEDHPTVWHTEIATLYRMSQMSPAEFAAGQEGLEGRLERR